MVVEASFRCWKRTLAQNGKVLRRRYVVKNTCEVTESAMGFTKAVMCACAFHERSYVIRTTKILQEFTDSSGLLLIRAGPAETHADVYTCLWLMLLASVWVKHCSLVEVVATGYKVCFTGLQGAKRGKGCWKEVIRMMMGVRMRRGWGWRRRCGWGWLGEQNELQYSGGSHRGSYREKSPHVRQAWQGVPFTAVRVGLWVSVSMSYRRTAQRNYCFFKLEKI